MRPLKKPRWIQKAKAATGGYFWLPCPLCGQEFGGHEWGRAHACIDVPGEPTRGQGVCPECEGRPETLAHEENQRRYFAAEFGGDA